MPRKKRLTEKRILFGQIAFRFGYVTKEQVDEALEIQRKIDDRGEKHKLLGMVMLENIMLSNEQLINILKYMDRNLKG